MATDRASVRDVVREVLVEVGHPVVDREWVREIVRETVSLAQEQQKAHVRECLRECLIELGVDPSAPHEMQRDFQHLREWRVAMEQVKSKGVMAVVAAVCSGVAAALWVGVKHIIATVKGAG